MQNDMDAKRMRTEYICFNTLADRGRGGGATGPETSRPCIVHSVLANTFVLRCSNDTESFVGFAYAVI